MRRLSEYNTRAVMSYDTLSRPQNIVQHNAWMAKVKRIFPCANEYFTDAEMINDMYKLNWTPTDVLTYWENHCG